MPPGYLVYSPKCRMMSLDPLASDVMRLFTQEEFEPCSNKKPLTSIKQNFEEDVVHLVFHKDQKRKFLSGGHNQLTCCYQEITRGGSNETADDRFK